MSIADLNISLQGPYINKDDSTAADFTVTGLDPGTKAEMTITDSAGTTVVVSNITSDGTVDVSSLADGELTVTVSATDTSGNTITGTGTGSILDTTADIVRSFKFVDSEGGTGNYLDKITNNNFIYFDDEHNRGYDLESTSTFVYSLDGGSTWIDGSLVTKDVNGSPKIGFEVDEGTYRKGDILVKTTDIAGNIYERTMYISSRKPLVIDTTADDFTVALANDTGTNNTDQISSNGQVNVSGIESTSYWYYRYKLGDSWSDWSAHKTSSETFFTLSDGIYSDVQVKSIDIAGNEKLVSMGAVTISTRSLPAPVISSIEDDDGPIKVFRRDPLNPNNGGFGEVVINDRDPEISIFVSGYRSGDVLHIYFRDLIGGEEIIHQHTISGWDISIGNYYFGYLEQNAPSIPFEKYELTLRVSAGVHAALSAPSAPVVIQYNIYADVEFYPLYWDIVGNALVTRDTNTIRISDPTGLTGFKVGYVDLDSEISGYDGVVFEDIEIVNDLPGLWAFYVRGGKYKRIYFQIFQGSNLILTKEIYRPSLADYFDLRGGLPNFKTEKRLKTDYKYIDVGNITVTKPMRVPDLDFFKSKYWDYDALKTEGFLDEDIEKLKATNQSWASIFLRALPYGQHVFDKDKTDYSYVQNVSKVGSGGFFATDIKEVKHYELDAPTAKMTEHMCKKKSNDDNNTFNDDISISKSIAKEEDKDELYAINSIRSSRNKSNTVNSNPVTTRLPHYDFALNKLSEPKETTIGGKPNGDKLLKRKF